METSKLNPRSHSYSWGGPFGALGIVVVLPLIVFAINTLCDGDGCSIANATLLPALIAYHQKTLRTTLLPTIALEIAWLVFHLLFPLLPIGTKVQGTSLRDGRRLTYRMNGLHAFILCHTALAATWYFGLSDFAFIETHFLAMAVGACIIAFFAALGLYVASLRKPQPLLALGGNTGNPFYDFFVGRELNPRFGAIDFKCTLEVRPGLIGWSMMNWMFVIRAHQQQVLTPAIVLVALFQSYYVAECQWFESAILTTMDIVHDGFGFMLMFGDIAWVPFLYGLQCKYLLYNPQQHDSLYLIIAVSLNVIGYVIFRGSNNEKNQFRTDPKSEKVSHLKVMKTSAGKSLIISGYWGICRHPNYVGDLMMAFSWSMLTGTSALLPYFYPIYFTVLLVHRQLRDEEEMLRKYGPEDWKRYCSHVPYRLIPYIY